MFGGTRALCADHMHIAWTIVAGQILKTQAGAVADLDWRTVEYEDGKPHLINKKLALDSTSLPFKCTLECQNFRLPDEKELTFSAYGHPGTDGAVSNLGNRGENRRFLECAVSVRWSWRGSFPMGRYTLVECYHQNRKGPGYIDIWKLKLDGSGEITVLHLFQRYAGIQGVESGRRCWKWMAFQMCG